VVGRSDHGECGDCGAEIGEPHASGCDVARCLWTGLQRIQCDKGLAAACCKVLRSADAPDLADDLAYHLDLDDPDHDCGEDIWTGEWPDKADAAALGWYSYFGPPWIRCSADHPEATPDLNRLVLDGRWDREAKRWVAR
jgi:hypothetical protein